MKTIVLTGGGTAGHVIPNLALLPQLKNKFDNICYVGSGKELEKDLVTKAGIPYFEVPTVKFKRNAPLSAVKIPFLMEKCIAKARRLLKELSPSVVFSKGGYVSLPTVFAAHGLKIPVIVHESDFSLGLANKISIPFCKAYITSFKNVPLGKKGIFLGQPIREEIFTGNKKNINFFKENKLKLLVVGGSTGAKALNDFIFINKDKLNFDIIHLTGKGKTYDNTLSNNYRSVEYVQNIFDYFDWADVVMSRAGASSCLELAALNKKTVLVPLSNKASRGDQVLNAKYYSSFDGIETLPEKDLTVDNLNKAISKTKVSKGNPFVFDKNVNEKIVDFIYKQI